MDTVRVDIAYRPLRIAWAVHSEDKPALNKAIRLTHATWGGRFNPIVLVDRPEEAKQFIEVFRADVICPIGDCEEVKKFPGKYPYLIDPFYGDVFRKTGRGEGQAQVLDIQNAIAHWHGTPMWKALEEGGIRVFKWDEDDPLAWPFLMQLGAYPKPDEIGIDYAQILASATVALREEIDRSKPIPAAVLDHPSIGYLTRHGLTRHHAVPCGWDYHGFFVGNASNVFDLVSFWNLRAADSRLQFIDPDHLARYAEIIPHHIELLTPRLARLREHERRIAVWGRPEVMEQAQSALSGRELTICRLGPGLWNGLNVQAPMMILGEETSLGVFNREREKPRVSFAMKDKPFNDDTWFYAQHLVASVSMIGGLFGDDHFTFHVPYVPELNEFFARTMFFDYNKIRVEPGRIGIVIDAADHDAFLDALPAADLIERVFNMAAVRPKLSGGGLIARQLLSRLGGVSNARVFKVPGVRRLLKTFGPSDTFTRNAALQLIGKKDPENPQASFNDYEDLYIEQREVGTKLTSAMVFAYLAEKGLFRIGFNLTCPTCRLKSWVSLDDVKQHVVCELCGASHDATWQLIDGDLRYRRTGVLGLEKNTQGAVPVALVLEQLTRNVSGAFREGIYGPSYDLEPMEGDKPPKCEIDFVMIIPERYPKRTSIIIGECKDGKGIDHKDVENLREVADAFPRERFRVFITLAKLSAFTPAEIELAKSLNDKYRQRTILLTASELEPYHIYDRASEEFKKRFHGTSAQELAVATAAMYFSKPSACAGMA